MSVSNTPVKTPLSYVGGKIRLAPWIISKFPESYEKMTYIEPYAGALSVLLAKKPSKVEIASDINLFVYSFFNVLKNKEKKQELIYLLRNTPYHQKELDTALERFFGSGQETDLMMAYSLFIICNMGWRGLIKKNNTLNMDIPSRKASQIFQNKKDRIHLVSERLLNVNLVTKPALKIIKQFDSDNSLFYIDPPYPETYTRFHYSYTIAEFNELLDVLKNIKGKFVLSFYKKDNMNLDKNWNLYYKDTIAVTNKARIECLALNY